MYENSFFFVVYIILYIHIYQEEEMEVEQQVYIEEESDDVDSSRKVDRNVYVYENSFFLWFT